MTVIRVGGLSIDGHKQVSVFILLVFQTPCQAITDILYCYLIIVIIRDIMY